MGGSTLVLGVWVLGRLVLGRTLKRSDQRDSVKLYPSLRYSGGTETATLNDVEPQGGMVLSDVFNTIHVVATIFPEASESTHQWGIQAQVRGFPCPSCADDPRMVAAAGGAAEGSPRKGGKGRTGRREGKPPGGRRGGARSRREEGGHPLEGKEGAGHHLRPCPPYPT